MDISLQIKKLFDYLSAVELWISIGTIILKLILIILLANIAIRVGKGTIRRLFVNRKRNAFHISERREGTLNKLLQSALSYVVYFIAFIMILETLNLPISSVLAGAGVAGIAVGFGAQNLVRDIITGFFIVFEDQFSVGDYIVVSGAEGTVEEIGLRTTKIKGWTGEVNVIPNGNIEQVVNYSIYNGLAIVDINVPYENDIQLAESIIEDIIKNMPEKYDQFVSEPTIHGVQALDLSHYVIRVIAETLPVYQWSGARAIRKEVKERLYKEGIEIPSPRLVMYNRSENMSEPNQNR